MGSSLLYFSIADYVQKGGGWVQIACKNAYVLNGGPRTCDFMMPCALHVYTTYSTEWVGFFFSLLCMLHTLTGRTGVTIDI